MYQSIDTRRGHIFQMIREIHGSTREAYSAFDFEFDALLHLLCVLSEVDACILVLKVLEVRSWPFLILGKLFAQTGKKATPGTHYNNVSFEGKTTDICERTRRGRKVAGFRMCPQPVASTCDVELRPEIGRRAIRYVSLFFPAESGLGHTGTFLANKNTREAHTSSFVLC